ncbi:hypothetical protein GCM10020331_092620 [Ectobacillus funiculus]
MYANFGTTKQRKKEQPKEEKKTIIVEQPKESKQMKEEAEKKMIVKEVKEIVRLDVMHTLPDGTTEIIPLQDICVPESILQTTPRAEKQEKKSFVRFRKQGPLTNLF